MGRRLRPAGIGETWVNHYGDHGKQSTRGLIAKGAENHPVLRGIRDGDIWGPTDVYEVRLPLPGDSQALVMGQVLDGMRPDSKPAIGKKNDRMMPVAWNQELHYRIPARKPACSRRPWAPRRTSKAKVCGGCW